MASMENTWFFAIFAFLFGSVIGSFLNVVIYRLPKGESLVTPGSHCPACDKELRWYELFPIFSFLLQGAKCRGCGTSIAWRYPAVEAMTGLLFLADYLALGAFDWRLLILAILTAVLVAITFIDIDHYIIPNKLLLFALPFCLVSPWFWTWPGTPIGDDYLAFLMGGVLGGGIMALFFFGSRGGMGFGDVKLMAVFGLFLDPQFVFWWLALGSGLGAIWGIVGMVGGKYNRKSPLPFGPFLAIGWLGIVIAKLLGFSGVIL